MKMSQIQSKIPVKSDQSEQGITRGGDCDDKVG
jgi:hypothetical protein